MCRICWFTLSTNLKVRRWCIHSCQSLRTAPPHLAKWIYTLSIWHWCSCYWLKNQSFNTLRTIRLCGPYINWIGWSDGADFCPKNKPSCIQIGPTWRQTGKLIGHRVHTCSAVTSPSTLRSPTQTHTHTPLVCGAESRSMQNLGYFLQLPVQILDVAQVDGWIIVCYLFLFLVFLSSKRPIKEGSYYIVCHQWIWNPSFNHCLLIALQQFSVYGTNIIWKDDQQRKYQTVILFWGTTLW